jgi:hypothetical protein
MKEKHMKESMDEDLRPKIPTGKIKADVEKIPGRLRLNRMFKYADIYQKLLTCQTGEAVKIAGVNYNTAKSICASLQNRTTKIHGKRLSLLKSKEPDTYFLMWRRE